jgi:excisionase family DNA binding protein
MIKQLFNKLENIEKILYTKKYKDIEFLDINEAANFLRLKKSTLYQLVFKRRIPYYKKTKILLFKKSDLIDWVEQKKVSSLVEVQSSYSSSKGGY